MSKVKSHTGIPGNERADSNADRGLSSRARLGRFSTFPFAPLQSPTVDFPAIHNLDQSTSSLINNISSVTETFFPLKLSVTRKPYLSPDTFSLIQSLPSTPPDSLKSLRNKIKRSAKIDKKNWVLFRLQEDHSLSPSDHWKTIKRVRSKHQPRTQSVNLPNGTPCTRLQKAQVLAEHLRDNVWNYQELPEPIDDPISPPIDNMVHPFTMADLYFSLRRTKTGRAPGPDQLPHSASSHILLKNFSSTTTTQRFFPIPLLTTSDLVRSS